MFIKLEQGRWLILISIIVFPVMLYLTRSLPTEVVGNIKNIASNNVILSQQSGVEITREFLTVSTSHTDNSTSTSLDIKPGIAGRSYISKDAYEEPVEKGSYRNRNKLFSQPQSYNYTSSNEISERYTATDTYKESPGIKRKTAGSSRVIRSESANNNENINNINANENPYLYDAGIESPTQNNNKKCPPVYIELNDYSRNMRAAMGCNSE